MPDPRPVPDWLTDLMARLERDGLGLERATPSGARSSAVLILFGEGPYGPDVLLIQRAADLRRHAGQPAFPGGAAENGDRDAAATAVREAGEETGLDPDGVMVLGELGPLFIPASGFSVTPVVGWWARRTAVRAVDIDEVAAVSVVPLAELADPARRCRVRYAGSGRTGPGFDLAGMLVWGFTALVLDRLLETGGWARPWRPGALREV
ncbi:MAG: NUDIX hydrolase [Mycobacteriales bacterium]